MDNHIVILVLHQKVPHKLHVVKKGFVNNVKNNLLNLLNVFLTKYSNVHLNMPIIKFRLNNRQKYLIMI